MSEKIKAGARNALNKYLTREMNNNNRELKPKRKNKTPERDLQKEIILKSRPIGFSLYITNSSGHWSGEAENYVSDLPAGMSDVTGDRDGIACYLEIKAPGKRYTLKMHQREFLIDKINRGCFAGCFDDLDDLHNTWDQWVTNGKYQNYLYEKLPKIPKRFADDGEPLF